MSMGWGDRLLSAILLQDEIDNYIGLDPNNNMHPYYNKMVELLVKEQNKKKYKFFCIPFEKSQ